MDNKNIQDIIKLSKGRGREKGKEERERKEMGWREGAREKGQ